MKSRRSIRVPLVITFTIALTFLLFGWRAGQERGRILTQIDSLRQELKELDQDPNQPPPLSTRVAAKGRDIDLKQIAADLISCGIDFKDASNEYALRNLAPSSRDRIVEAIEDVLPLNQEELKTLLTFIETEPDLHYRVRQNLLTFILARWGSMAPDRMLNHLAASPQSKEQLRSGYRYVISVTMRSWINQAPDDVLKWMRKSGNSLPEDIVGSAVSYFSGAMAQSEPLKTFDFISEFSPKPHSYFPYILRTSKLTPDDRAQAITRARQMAEDLEEPAEKQEFLTKNIKAMVLSQETHEADFQTSIDTIKSSNLQIDEIEFIWNMAEADLGYYIKEDQTGDWILWLQKNIPDGRARHRIKQLLERWKEHDMDAARDFMKNHGLEE